jgi:hypothetical protein
MLLRSDRASVKIASPSLSVRQPDDDRPRKRHVKAVGFPKADGFAVSGLP